MPRSTIPPETTRYREREALSLRRKGWSFAEIARHLEVSAEGARKAFLRANDRDAIEFAKKAATESVNHSRRLLRVFNLALAEAEGRGGLEYLKLAHQAARDLATVAGFDMGRPRMTGGESAPDEAMREVDRDVHGDQGPDFEAIRRLERRVEKLIRRVDSSAKTSKGKTDPIPPSSAECVS